MPVIAIGAALASVAVAGSAVAATVGGIAAISAVTAFEIAAAVGATLGAIGAVTRDKNLSMAGLAIGAIGGIGALASSAGLLGADAASGASLFGPSTAASTADTAAGAAGAIGDLPTPPIPPEGGGGSTIDLVTGNAQPPPTDQMSFATTAETPAALAGPRAVVTPPDTPPPVTGANATPGSATGAPAPVVSGEPASLDIPTPPVTPNNLGATDTKTGLTIQDAVDPVTGKITSMPGDTSGGLGMFKGMFDFANKNPAVTMGVVQAGGSFLSGATSTLTPAQVADANARAAANNATAALTAQQTANLAGPKAVATTLPVNRNPPGIINRAPQVAV